MKRSLKAHVMLEPKKKPSGFMIILCTYIKLYLEVSCRWKWEWNFIRSFETREEG